MEPLAPSSSLAGHKRTSDHVHHHNEQACNASVTTSGAMPPFEADSTCPSKRQRRISSADSLSLTDSAINIPTKVLAAGVLPLPSPVDASGTCDASILRSSGAMQAALAIQNGHQDAPWQCGNDFMAHRPLGSWGPAPKISFSGTLNSLPLAIANVQPAAPPDAPDPCDGPAPVHMAQPSTQQQRGHHKPPLPAQWRPPATRAAAGMAPQPQAQPLPSYNEGASRVQVRRPGRVDAGGTTSAGSILAAPGSSALHSQQPGKAQQHNQSGPAAPVVNCPAADEGPPDTVHAGSPQGPGFHSSDLSSDTCASLHGQQQAVAAPLIANTGMLGAAAGPCRTRTAMAAAAAPVGFATAPHSAGQRAAASRLLDNPPRAAQAGANGWPTRTTSCAGELQLQMDGALIQQALEQLTQYGAPPPGPGAAGGPHTQHLLALLQHMLESQPRGNSQQAGQLEGSQLHPQGGQQQQQQQQGCGVAASAAGLPPAPLREMQHPWLSASPGYRGSGTGMVPAMLQLRSHPTRLGSHSGAQMPGPAAQPNQLPGHCRLGSLLLQPPLAHASAPHHMSAGSSALVVPDMPSVPAVVAAAPAPPSALGQPRELPGHTDGRSRNGCSSATRGEWLPSGLWPGAGSLGAAAAVAPLATGNPSNAAPMMGPPTRSRKRDPLETLRQAASQQAAAAAAAVAAAAAAEVPAHLATSRITYLS